MLARVLGSKPGIKKHFNRFLNPGLLTMCLLCILCFTSNLSLASTQQHDDSAQLVEYLHQEKIDLTRAINETSVLLEPPNQANLSQAIKQNAAMFTLVHAQIASLEGFLINQRKQQRIIASQIKKATMAPGRSPNDPELQKQLKNLATQNEMNNQTIALITENIALAHRYETALLNIKRQLGEWNVKKQGTHHLDELQQQMNSLHQERSVLYQKNVQLQQDKQGNPDFYRAYDDELKLQLNNHHITLINAQVSELEVQIKLVKADDLFIKQQDIKTILSSIESYKEANDQLDDIKQSLITMLELLKEERSHVSDNDIKLRIIALQNKTLHFLNQLNNYRDVLVERLELKQQALKKQLSVRQPLAGYQVNSWGTFKLELSRVPMQVVSYFTELVTKIQDGYTRQGIWTKAFLWLSLTFIFLVSLALNRQLKAVTQDKERSRLSAHLYDGVLVLLSRNMPQIALLAMLLTGFVFIQLPLSSYSLFFHLVLVWFIFRTLIIIARMIFLERNRELSGQDVRFFYRLKWLLIVGGLTTGCMVLSQQLPLSLLIQDIFTRLFMLFIFASSFVMWASKDVFPLLLRPAFKTRKRYLKKAISLLFVLLPLTLFTTGIMGLIGYMNLAWSMSRYQANLVVVIIAYVLARGLMSDALELLSEWMAESLRSGWLWIEVFLKPMDKIIHLVLLFSSVIFLCQLFGVYTEMNVLEWLKHVGHYELIGVSGVHITVESVLEFFVVLSIFIWAAKWTREFCYRWLYRDSRDEGVRNSLSVFTQYGVILLGGYITLRVLGLDFGGMSIVIGGLAVGMGFGLRDFASNIVGGIMLLIERPVREGDLITLGEHEGRVAHIGIRSMRVSSWDNTEVLIPNAETFNKPFINWTHQDSVVRTVVPIKVSREDDPLMIQQLIFEVLAIIPEILDEPPVQVFLKQIDEALIDFEVRYFINIQRYTRFEIRSKFLFALMAQFKAAGVRSPIPPLSVELKGSDFRHER